MQPSLTRGVTSAVPVKHSKRPRVCLNEEEDGEGPEGSDHDSLRSAMSKKMRLN